MPKYDCCVCDEPFKFGPHVYEGRPIPGWQDLMICRECEKSNHDGVVSATHPHLMQRLKSLGIEVVLNKDGWIVLLASGQNDLYVL